jgi:hypothetical protein
MAPSKTLFQKNPLSRPWTVFVIFVLINSLLSYVELPTTTRLLLGLVGWLLPLALLLRSSSIESPTKKPSWTLNPLKTPSWWVWVLIFVLGLCFRFYRLDTFLDYPLQDEIVNALCAIRLDSHWDWHPFFYWTQLPPFYIWLLSLLFKATGISLFNLWLLPALLSLFAIGLFTLALRPFVSKSLTFIFFTFLCLQFWPCFVSRFSHQAVLMLFWEAAAFLLLGKALATLPGTARRGWTLLLGVWTGLGFATYFGWPLVAALLFLTLGSPRGEKGNLSRKDLGWFLAGLLPALFPLVAAAFQSGFGTYLSGIFIANSNPDNQMGWSFLRNTHYFTSFFWMGWRDPFAYTPRWGGFLNPIVGAFFVIGLRELWKFQTRSLARWTGAAFAVLFFPILLANNTNWFHVLALLPLFLAITALGVLSLLPPGRKGKILFICLLPLSCLLDGVNLEKTRVYINRTHPLPETIQAYQLLNQIQGKEGPGIVFSRLTLRPWTPFLDFSTHPFNALHGPESEMRKASWTAVLTNVNYRPFLARRFPGGKAYRITAEKAPPDGGLMLWVMKTSPERMRVLEQWRAASSALDPFFDQYLQLSPGRTYQEMLETLQKAYPSFQGDPFLESSFWELISYVQFRKKFMDAVGMDSRKTYLEFLNQPLPEALLNESALGSNLQALETAVTRGIPAAHLYYQEGIYWSMAKNPKKARIAFQAARKAPLDLTQAQNHLPPKDP